MNAFLGLATGDIITGEMICSGDPTPGEVVLYHSDKFHYQILTDPVSYNRIIVSDAETVANRWPMTNEIESYAPHLKALVMLGRICDSPFGDSHYNLVNYFSANGISLFKPHNPYWLKRFLNRTGPVRGIITPQKQEIDQLFSSHLRDSRNPHSQLSKSSVEYDPVRKLSTRLEYFWDLPDQCRAPDLIRKYLLVAYDLGLSYSTLRNLKNLGCDIRIVPADYSPEDVIALKPEGILLAGGPGYPGEMGYAISNISRLIGLRPILATGLGAALLALAVGCKIEIMKRPHFGEDIIVADAANGDSGQRLQRYPTRQDHLVSIERRSLEKEGFRITLANPNDGTVEAFEHPDYLIQAYAFSLGGLDELTIVCLEKYISMMETHRATQKRKLSPYKKPSR